MTPASAAKLPPPSSKPDNAFITSNGAIFAGLLLSVSKSIRDASAEITIPASKTQIIGVIKTAEAFGQVLFTEVGGEDDQKSCRSSGSQSPAPLGRLAKLAQEIGCALSELKTTHGHIDSPPVNIESVKADIEDIGTIAGKISHDVDKDEDEDDEEEEETSSRPEEISTRPKTESPASASLNQSINSLASRRVMIQRIIAYDRSETIPTSASQTSSASRAIHPMLRTIIASDRFEPNISSSIQSTNASRNKHLVIQTIIASDTPEQIISSLLQSTIDSRSRHLVIRTITASNGPEKHLSLSFSYLSESRNIISQTSIRVEVRTIIAVDRVATTSLPFASMSTSKTASVYFSLKNFTTET
ncbi:hypothetical protein MMC21_005145 [Puttea exsequens]|nr:hypothetical protein [Puttea exsequens]